MKNILLLVVMIISLGFSAKSQVVINEVYGGGGNTGATFRNDFIELYNNSNAAADLAGWSVQYASSAGSNWAVTILSGSIPAKGYYLVQESAGANGTTGLPTPDATGTITMSATGGKVALVNSITTLSGTCPAGLVDQVGLVQQPVVLKAPRLRLLLPIPAQYNAHRQAWIHKTTVLILLQARQHPITAAGRTWCLL